MEIGVAVPMGFESGVGPHYGPWFSMGAGHRRRVVASRSVTRAWTSRWSASSPGSSRLR